jgi:tetratricopeptide (TPR) repeat protein
VPKAESRRQSLQRLTPALVAALALLWLACPPSQPTVVEPSRFSDLSYGPTAAKYKAAAEAKFQARDKNYVLALLDYAIVGLYDRDTAAARKAFTAAYKVDKGDVAEMDKAYQWLVVNSRTVYRLTKREKELCHYYLGLCYLVAGNTPEALVEFKKLRQIDQEASKLPAVNFWMGLAYELLGNWGDALIEYRGLDQIRWGTDGKGGLCYPDAAALVAETERRRDAGVGPDSSRQDIVIEVEHQTAKSVGSTDVYVDDEKVASLPAAVDYFGVKLTGAEASRKAAQEVGSSAARTGCRCCAGIAAEYFLGRGASDLTDVAADIAVGKESDNVESRFWRYAPVAVTVGRVSVPREAREIRLVFHAGDGVRAGECRFPLGGAEARTLGNGPVYLIAGLADEFYVYR